MSETKIWELKQETELRCEIPQNICFQGISYLQLLYYIMSEFF